MRIGTLLLESINTKAEMKHLFDDVSSKYYKKYKGVFPYPKFTVRPYKYKGAQYTGGNNTITLNKAFTDFDDPKKATKLKWVLKKIIWHEAIHYYQYWIEEEGGKKRRVGPKHGHGNFFKGEMSRINRGEGKSVIDWRVIDWDDVKDVFKVPEPKSQRSMIG